MDKVPFARENVRKCACPGCPVQIKSRCSKEKAEKAKETMEKGKMPAPKEVSQVYCSGGKAACSDLDFKQMCICGSCPVWAQYKLMKGKPSMYFCRDGKAG